MEDSVNLIKQVVKFGGIAINITNFSMLPGTISAENPAEYEIVPIIKTFSDWIKNNETFGKKKKSKRE